MKGTYWRSLVGFFTVFVSYLIYAKFAVPWIEPQIQLPAASAASNPVTPGNTVTASPLLGLEHLFPADAWELDRRKTKILDSENGKLLFRDYQPLPDGSIEVKPFSVIFLAATTGNPVPGRGGARAQGRRPIVLRAKDGATLKFDPPLQLGTAEIGRFVGGRIRGRVQIYSPSSHQHGDNALQIETRNLQMDQQRVFTPHDISFRFGRHWGSGRNLTIHMLRRQSAKDSPISISGIKSVELVYVDKMHIDASRHERADPPGSPPTAHGNLVPKDADAPLEITCRGPFLLDAEQMIASFEDHVDVLRIRPDGPSDQLNCQLLEVHFGELDPSPDRPGQRPPSETSIQPISQSNSSLARTPTAKPASPFTSGLDVKRIVAVGYPVTIHADYEVEAKRLQCDLGQGGEIDTFWADGAGRVYQVGEDGRTTFSATWSKELTFQPHEGNQVLSLIGQSVVHLPGKADFTAEQLHLWIRQQLVNSSAGAPGEQKELVPHKMLARGNVRFESLRVSGHTERMEAWFIEPESPSTAESVAGSQTSGQPSGPANDQATTAAQTPPSQQSPFARGTTTSPENASKYDVHGKLVRMELVWDRQEKRVDTARELIVADEVRVIESLAADPDAVPLEIKGDLLNVLPGDKVSSAVANVLGNPAQVSARGMKLQGKQINLDQATNRIWIDSPGTMTLPSTGFGRMFESQTGPSPTALATPPGTTPTGEFAQTRIHRVSGSGHSTPAETLVSWQGQMDFDGRLARFVGEVAAHTTSTAQNNDRMEAVIRGEKLHVTLNRRINFADPKPPPRDADLLQAVVFDQRVEIENRTRDMFGKLQSIDRLSSQNLRYTVSANQIVADGPGWASSARFGTGHFSTGNFSTGNSDKSVSGRPLQPTVPPMQSDRLTYTQVNFQRRLTGDTYRREVQFTGQVEAAHGPIAHWDQRLSPRDPAGLGADGVLLTCNELTVAEMGPPVGEMRNLELRAVGDTYAQGREFRAHADRISYSNVKDLIVLEGNGREDARLTQQSIIGGQENRFAARKILYWKKTGSQSQ